MSFAITTTNLASAVAGSTGSVDWAAIAQSIGFPNSSDTPSLQLYNESPCELQLTMSTGEQFVLPAGGWQTIALNSQCTRLSYKVLAVLNASPIVALLLGTWFAPGETVPAAPILGNSPIGAAVAISPIANALQGVNQLQAVTEVDQTGVHAGAILIPTSLIASLWLKSGDSTSAIILETGNVIQVAATNIQLNGATEAFGAVTMDAAATVGTTLGVTGATTLSSTLGVTGATTLSSTVHAVGAVTMDAAATVGTTLGVTGAVTHSSTSHFVGAVTMDAAATVGTTLGVTGAVTLTNKITTYNNEATAGVGVPYIVAIAENVSVTGTGLTSILTYTTPNDGANHSIRVNAWCDVNSNVSGNNISLQVVYTDPRTGATNTTPFSTATSTASVSFNGATSITNGRYAMYPYTLYAKPNTVITIQYRDPTNTPADKVSAFIERIS